ncbi:MAG: cobalamin-dependent protein [Deltaproteobacteria bacterium]|jgi:methanogenic corrinoid protein MtbC1|nr:cobalamin-dependent protein [Deltaproteobacteria bacterium]MBW2477793.1 cobalamin-dependent protein [Deltaproteobacteria bacterium]MBW2503401.1 cobalamin-dependent protein [Deltaproteobacteria bacterium]MBW2520246.1 cobalamin-dependent protein [Deltaproteobacteria bacterium]
MKQSDSNELIDKVYVNYFNALLSGQRQACLAIVEELMGHGVPLKSIYLSLFERSMYAVGELWESNSISVAVEHIATAITENAMNLLHPMIFASEHSGRKAVISCVANEYHQIGGKMVADIFELHGWDGYFLGANTPVKDLLHLVGEKKPDVVCFSLTLISNLGVLLDHVDTLSCRFPKMPIIVGGQAFVGGETAFVPPSSSVQLVVSLDALENFIDQNS